MKQSLYEVPMLVLPISNFTRNAYSSPYWPFFRFQRHLTFLFQPASRDISTRSAYLPVYIEMAAVPFKDTVYSEDGELIFMH